MGNPSQATQYRDTTHNSKPYLAPFSLNDRENHAKHRSTIQTRARVTYLELVIGGVELQPMHERIQQLRRLFDERRPLLLAFLLAHLITHLPPLFPNTVKFDTRRLFDTLHGARSRTRKDCHRGLPNPDAVQGDSRHRRSTEIIPFLTRSFLSSGPLQRKNTNTRSPVYTWTCISEKK